MRRVTPITAPFFLQIPDLDEVQVNDKYQLSHNARQVCLGKKMQQG